MKAPRTLIAILIVNLLLAILAAVAAGRAYELALLALWCAVGWSSYKGSQTAAWLLASALALDAARTIFDAVAAPGTRALGVYFDYVYAVVLVSSAAYLFFSQRLKAFQYLYDIGEYGR